MKRNLKRAVSVLLAAAVIFGTTAFIGEFDIEDIGIKAEASNYTSGYYTYTVDNGNARILDVDTAISGDITIPSSLDGYPVTEIYADFYNCSNITSVTIPESIAEIEESSMFVNCLSLTKFTVDENNKYFSNDENGILFNKDKTELIKCPGGHKRTSYNIPDGVTKIRGYAFGSCIWITSITIPESVTSIGLYAIDGYNLTSITVDAANKYYTTDEYGVLFNKDKTQLIKYPDGNERTSYIIPETVVSISGNAFSSSDNLTSITIPDSVTTIGFGVFQNCYGLTSITIPDSVTSIGGSAFSRCRNLTNITLPVSITSMGKCVFEDTAYYNNENNWQNDVLYIGNHLIEAKDTVSGSYKIKDGTLIIANRAFDRCTSLSSVTIPDSVTIIGSSAFDECTSLVKITIGSGVTSIGERAFEDCTSLKSVSISNSVTSIGDNAFEECTSLANITIGNGVTSIGEGAFRDTKYYNNENNWENGVLYIGKHLIEAKRKISGSYEIKDGTLCVADYAFDSCKALTSITIPDSVKYIGNGVLFNCDGLISITIPDGVISIGEDAFGSSSGLESIVIPDSVTSIGKWAFEDCTSLTDVYYTGTKNEWNKIKIDEYNEALTNATIHYNYVPGSEPTTTKPATTKPATTKPAVVPTTTKPTTTKPTTTKPSVVPTTRPTVPSTTKPTTTKPVVEEENIKKPSTSTVNYGETLILHINASNIPENAKIEWSVDGEGVTLKPSADGLTCAVTSTATGNVTITAKYTDASGVEHVSEQEIKSNASLWQKIVSFFKNLFGMNRVIEQRIKFN